MKYLMIVLILTVAACTERENFKHSEYVTVATKCDINGGVDSVDIQNYTSLNNKYTEINLTCVNGAIFYTRFNNGVLEY